MPKPNTEIIIRIHCAREWCSESIEVEPEFYKNFPIVAQIPEDWWREPEEDPVDGDPRYLCPSCLKAWRETAGANV